MIRTQIQLPDNLYDRSKDIAARLEISLAELVRRGLEYMIAVSPSLQEEGETWELPKAHRLGGRDPFADPSWREAIHTERLKVAEKPADYKVRRKKSK
ncbi:MAG: antitoxin [Verrucomicrobia bacterium]|nr:antitoxin [Verrucomicrobiota bacterium]